MNVTTDLNGNFTGTILPQGNGFVIGDANVPSYNAVFSGFLNVQVAGTYTIRTYHDDGFFWGVGGGAVRVAAGSTGLSNPPASGLTPFYGYPVMGSDNNPSNSPVDNVITFPVAGTYPFEYDLAGKVPHNWEGTITTIVSGVEKVIPPAGYLALTPNTLPSQTTGASLNFGLIVVDASGAVIANTPVVFSVTGANARQSTTTTDATGHATFTYTGTQPGGVDTVQATATINGTTGYSNSVQISWNSGTNQAPVVSAGSAQSVVLPNTITLTGSVSDDGLPLNSTLTIAWSMASGPGTVTFGNPHSPVTAAAFDKAGTYVLQLSANDSALTTTANVTITVTGSNNPGSPPGTDEPGWISGVTDHGTVTGVVTISVPASVTLQSGTLSYWPISNPSAITVLNGNTMGSGAIGTLDTTLLPNGTYWIRLSATNTSGTTTNNQALVTVVGDYKPGRVTASITDLTVPAAGLPISITRVYDSLERSRVEDFGNGWSLTTSVHLEVDPSFNVSLTIGGKRRTFFFTPQANAIFSFFYVPQYTAEPGFFGSMTTTGDNCFGVLLKIGNLYQCGIGPLGFYQPNGYVYTDPYGRVYTMGTDGSLQSLKDLNGNTLTVTAAGISSTNGLNVPFVRDAQGRITRITDTLGHQYNYTYDASGNLASVTYPGIATPAQYTYDATHLLTSEIDMNGHTAATTTYYPDGKLKSVTQPVDGTTTYTTQYSYDVPNRTTTVTNPDGGTVVTVTDSYGKPLTVTESVASGLQRTTTHVYDAKHKETSMTDALGKTATYTYDSNGFQTSRKDPLGNVWSRTYNQVGEPTTVTDPVNVAQNVTNVAYDANFRIASVTDSLGSVAQFTSNPAGLPLTFKDARGNASSFVYDQYGNRTSHTDALGRTIASVYDTLGNLASQTDPRGNSTTYSYDPFNRRMSMTDAAGKVTQYAYDGEGNKISETDQNNHQTTYTYDNANRLTQIRYADNTTRSYTYDFRNNKLTETDQLGRTTKYFYDLAGRLTTMTVAFGTADAATTSYTYDGDDRQLTQTDPRGNTTTYTYDDAGRMTSMKDGKGNLTTYGYDSKGQRTSMLDAKNRTTAYTYDARGRQLTTATPDGKTVTKTYDGLGKTLTEQDEENNTTAYGYNAASELLTVTDTLNQITRYSYDLAGNKISQKDARNNTTSYLWDSLNRRTSRMLPLGQTEQYSYDFEGNMKTRVDSNVKTTTYAYDSLNRLLSRTPDASFGASPVSFTYTAMGQRQTMTDASGVTNYTYNNRDQALTKSTPQGALTYTYDPAGNVTSVLSSNASGTSVNYSWDANNRLSSVTDNRTGGTTNYVYDPTNQLSSMAYPNGVTHGYGYDTRDRLTSLGVNGPAGVLANYAQMFSPSGRKTSDQESTGRTENYSYDTIYRLTNESITGDPTAANNGGLAYALDQVGNRMALTSTLAALPSQTKTYDNDDRISGDMFDSNGNTLTSNGVTYAYEFEDRLVNTSTGVQITYDGHGNRVLETVGGVTTRFLVDDHNPTGYAQVAEEIVSGAVVAQYTYGLMRISQGRAGGTSYYGYDAGGSTRQLLSGAGAVTDTYTYDAFGNTVAQTGSTPNEFLYRGEQFDAALVMYYLRARYYLPRTGRFLTADKYEEPAFAHCSCLGPGKTVEPLAVLSLFAFPTSRVDRDRKLVDYKKAHEYLYSAADPVNLIDPSGQGFIENAELNGFEADDVLAEFATQQAERGFPAHVVRFMCLAIAALWAAQSPEATVFEIEQYMEYCLARAGL